MDNKELLRLIFTALETEKQKLVKQIDEYGKKYEQYSVSDKEGDEDTADDFYHSMLSTYDMARGFTEAENIVLKVAKENGI
ncbi:hypothetical protein J5991_00745 [Methanocorpusculum sp.]|nr:hypothetical protein [Methanocorpusculum sp.]